MYTLYTLNQHKCDVIKFKMTDDNQASGGSPVLSFYNNKSIFITGATGFMGKVLVEKLLRSTTVKKLYLLIRQKKGVQTFKRLEELLASRVFQSLTETKPGILNKVEAISGDITEPGLGIGKEDEAVLVEEVSIVFHCAATIRFDEELKKAIIINVEAVLSLIGLCKKMKKLESLVHVSTAYCNCDLAEISEKIYAPPNSPQRMIDLCKWKDEATLNEPQFTLKLIGNRPNTYTFTKALAESLLVTEGGSLPVAIVRPSIVVAAWNEPLPGWVDNLNGPSGLLAGCGKGILRTVYVLRGKVADMVPVDISVNLMCAVAWRTAEHLSNDIPVYNCTSGAINPITWGNVEDCGLDYVLKYPMENIVWYPGGTFKSNQWVNKAYQIMVHYIPAFLADSVAWAIGKKPCMVKIYNKIHKATKTLEYFTTNDWRWTNDNMLTLHSQLTEADRDVFNFDVAEIRWLDFIENYVKGLRQYVFKEDMATLPEARRHLGKLYWLDWIVKGLLFLMFWTVLLWNLPLL